MASEAFLDMRSFSLMDSSIFKPLYIFFTVDTFVFLKMTLACERRIWFSVLVNDCFSSIYLPGRSCYVVFVLQSAGSE